MILPILHYPDKRLRTIAKDVDVFDESLVSLVDDMFETMYEAPGIGLAATQIDHHHRVIVIDISDNKSEPICLVNPTITDKYGEIESEEGCLSVPEYFELVKRYNSIEVKTKNQHGEDFEVKAEGMLSVCIQHEIDHLNGILFVDRLSKLKQSRLIKKTKKSTKQL
ncbi:MAG: peptide deformylase [Candidatus Thioglobus sp.]